MSVLAFRQENSPVDCFVVDEASATSGGCNEPKKCSGRKKQAMLCVVFEGTTMGRLERGKSCRPHHVVARRIVQRAVNCWLSVCVYACSSFFRKIFAMQIFFGSPILVFFDGSKSLLSFRPIFCVF